MQIGKISIDEIREWLESKDPEEEIDISMVIYE